MAEENPLDLALENRNLKIENTYLKESIAYLKGKKELDTVKLVTWRDSNRYIDQLHKDYEFEVVVITTVGFLLSETDTQIVLAQDKMSGEAPDDYRGIIVIPKENIINQKRIQ